MYRDFIKRIIDFLVSLIGLILLFPLLLVVALVLLIINKENPLFFQSRPGKNNKIFKIVKLKTMTSEKDQNGNLLPDDERWSKTGSFVRKTSLDEIPQLFNVLKGDMSIVGPRPLLPEYLSLYSDFEKRRHEVKPGITGWAQVNGRNTISWKKKFDFDVWYVDHISFLVDIKILLLTIKKVFISEGIDPEGKEVTKGFNGH